MKLNLLPQTVVKRSSAPVFIILALLIVIAASAASAFLVVSSKAALEAAVKEREELLPGYANNAATAAQAEQVILQATNFDRNVKLVESAAKHNNVYPDLYDSLFPYIPAFYRIQSVNAVGSGGQATVTLVGHIDTFQQYADLAIALWRIPGVISVQRAGYAPKLPAVLLLTPDRQKNVSVKAGEAPLPDDVQQRIEILKSQAAAVPTGYVGVGGFGTDAVPKGDTLTSQTVTMTVLLTRNLQVPVPSATLAAAQAVPTAPAAGATPAAPAGNGGDVDR